MLVKAASLTLGWRDGCRFRMNSMRRVETRQMGDRWFGVRFIWASGTELTWVGPSPSGRAAYDAATCEDEYADIRRDQGDWSTLTVQETDVPDKEDGK
jgi:hypothetical protein